MIDSWVTFLGYYLCVVGELIRKLTNRIIIPHDELSNIGLLLKKNQTVYTV